ncbi:hypothetical protein [Nocardia sp. A7]|uniref:hypothetical protein n=1 Tax=Nocardia sp. A7 TaxID=2789274 RepID=UPI00397BA503
MNHAEHDESIGSMLASIAAALREVSDKLDIVAARVQLDVPTFPVDEDLPDQTRIRRLESWAFCASQDISRLSSRLDALDNGGESDSGPARGTRSRREVREAAEAAERAADGPDDHLSGPDPLPAHQNRDDDGSRPPLERRNSPARPTTDHLGDPTALAATPIPRTAAADAATPFGQPVSFDTDSFAVAAGSEHRRPAPARLGATGTGAGSGERVAAASAGNPSSPSGTNGIVRGVADDIATPRNGTPVPAVIGTVLTAPVGDHASGTTAQTSTKHAAAAHSEDRAPTSGLDSTTASAAAGTTLPGSAELSAVVREGGFNGFGPDSGAMKHVPVEEQSTPTPARIRDPLTAETSPDAVIERARPVKKPTESSATGGARLSVASPEEPSSIGNGAARLPSAHTANGHPSSGFTGGPSTPNGKPINGFESHSFEAAPLRNETPTPTGEFQPRPDTSVDAHPVGNTANGIHWSFSEDPAPPTPDRNGHARNGFTTDSARRAESLFDDFTPRDRMSTGEIPESQTVSGPPARLTPPTEITTQPTPDPTRTVGPSHVNGSSDSPAYPDLSSADRSANIGRLLDPVGLTDHAPLTTHAARTDQDRPAADYDPPTLGLPTGRESSTSSPDPLERPVADPIPPTATDSAGITVTGTYRAFDIERAHVDKLQAMLDELKRSAGLPPGRRDVFGPPTPDLG